MLDSPSRGSEDMGRTEPHPLATLGKDTGQQVKGQSPSNPTTPLGQFRHNTGLSFSICTKSKEAFNDTLTTSCYYRG